MSFVADGCTKGALETRTNNIHCVLMGGPSHKMNYTGFSCRARQIELNSCPSTCPHVIKARKVEKSVRGLHAVEVDPYNVTFEGEAAELLRRYVNNGGSLAFVPRHAMEFLHARGLL